MIRISTIFLVFLLTLSFNVWGQSKWKAGYIIKITGDTIYGQVASKFFENKKKCSFRSNKNSQAQTFNTSELGGYGFTDAEIFLPKLIVEETTTDTLFVHSLIQGKINFYKMDYDMPRFFLEKDGKMYELKNTKALAESESGSKYYRERKEYVGILSFLLSEADMIEQINNTQLTTASLMNLIKAYHQKICGNADCITYTYQPLPVKISIGLHTGLTLNSVRFGQSMLSDERLNMTLGARFYFDNVLTGARKISFTLDIALQSFTNYDLTPKDVFPSLVRYNGIESFNAPVSPNLKAIFIKIPLMINYTFTNKKFRPYLGAGLQNMFVISQNKDFFYRNFVLRFGNSIPRYHYGFAGRLGGKYILSDNKFIYTEFHYENTFNPESIKALRFVNNLFGINVGCSF